jgi:hypothetical protein
MFAGGAVLVIWIWWGISSGPRRHYRRPQAALQVIRPIAVPANFAATSDDAQVIGVGVSGHWRAYCISEMQTPPMHVINDVVDGMPVTVTFCDANNCARVFTNRETSNRPLDVGIGGFWRDGMLLHVADRNFSQSSPDIPFYDLEFDLTTWGKWKRAHPQTDICAKLGPNGCEPANR